MRKKIARDVLRPVKPPREQKRPGARVKRLAAHAARRQGARYWHAEFEAGMVRHRAGNPIEREVNGAGVVMHEDGYRTEVHMRRDIPD